MRDIIQLLVDPYLFPARGRKPQNVVSLVEAVGHKVDPYLFPARGRKLEPRPVLGGRPVR